MRIASPKTIIQTKESVNDNIERKEVIYPWEIGTRDCEKPERVAPFCVELVYIRICHGAFVICTEKLATGYAGK